MIIRQNNKHFSRVESHSIEKLDSVQLVEHLQSYVPAEFPTDSSCDNALSSDSDASFYLGHDACAALGILSKNVSIHLEVTLLAVVRMLHFRYSGINQAAIGLHTIPPKSSMRNAATQSQNTLVVCIPVDRDESLSTIAQVTEKAVLEASKCLEIPFVDIITKLGSNHSGKYEPIAPVLVTVNRAGYTNGYIAASKKRAQFSMEWHFHPVGNQFKCELLYNHALFKKESIKAFSTNFLDILKCFINEPGLSVEQIPFSHALEQLIQVQIPIHPPPQPMKPRGLLADAFSDIAAKHKEQKALIDGSLILTYHELDILSSALAKSILDATQGRDKLRLISFCIPPSALAIIAILGIIKYGAAYVPLDIRFPTERLESLLSDSGARLLITTSRSPKLNIDTSNVVSLDISDFLADWETVVASWDPTTLPSYPQHTNIAYVMYTSGSTGKPKGVANKQSSVLALMSSRHVRSLGPDSRIAQINNLAWDASIFDIWCTLLSGATLVCFNQYDVLDPPTLATQFEKLGVDCCLMSPALFRQILNIAPHIFRCLRHLTLGGEAIYYESLRRIREINPSIVLQNAYGPTEACMVSTTFDINGGDEIPDDGPVPIGRPIKAVHALVVDVRNRLVPPGVIGELIVGGECVAEGYLNRPSETLNSFVTLDFEELGQPNSTYYRTGDAVKWRSDGQLQFIGRMNSGQVKIRGQRLELAEVEAAIVSTKVAKSAAVALHKPVDGRDPFLIAYVVLDPKLQGQPSQSAASKTQTQVEEGSESFEVIDTWRNMYDEMYSSYNINDARAKFLGWDSMITGLPIPQDEMNEWLHDTLRPFFQQRPRNVFEVGCGIGNFLYEMAPFVEHIWAIEPSGEAVERLNTEFRAHKLSDKFSVWHATADRISELPHFQTEFVLINSVIQYLPSETYLYDTLIQIIDRCAPGSRILLGDVRSLPLDDLLNINILLHRWRNELGSHTVQELRNRILSLNQNRSELLIDPTFFFDLQCAVSSIAHVEIIPKVLEKSNELSQFRYQVILHLHQELKAVVPKIWNDYEALGWNPASLEDALQTFVHGDEYVLAVECIPNKFLSWEKEVRSLVFSSSSDLNVSLASLPSKCVESPTGWSAWDLEQLAKRFGVSVRLSFARQPQTTSLDAVFIKATTPTVPYAAFKYVRQGEAVIPESPTRSPDSYSILPEHDVLDQLKGFLPMHMIPKAIYSMPSLPLLPSGKLDRRRLADMADADAGRSFDMNGAGVPSQPNDDLESQVCQIFGEMLSVDAVSPTSDFFLIGGHSLMATRVKAAIESEFNIPFPLQDIFVRRTPREVASKIAEISSSPDVNGITPISSHSQGTDYPLSFAQGRLWFLAQLAGPGDISYNSSLALNLSGDLQVDVMSKTIHEIASRHEVLRTIFVEVDGVPKSRVLDVVPRLEIVDVQPETGLDKVQELLQQYIMRPFQLDSEVTFRPILLKISPVQSILLITMHHITWDGFSIDVFQDELAEIYASFRLSKEHSLPPLQVQYKDFAQWQNSDDFKDLLQPQIEYWKTHLSGSRPAEFPTDFPRSLHRNGGAGTYVSHCSQGLLDKLQAACQRERVTLYMWLLTVFRIVHYQLTGQEDASFGYPIANRNRFETGKLLGFFANTQVFRLKVRPGATFSDLLRQTRELLLTAFANEDLPFDSVVSLLNPERDLTRNPLIQVMCTHETVNAAPFSFGGIKVSRYPVPLKTIRMDIETYFRVRDGELRADIVYSTDLFKESTIAGLAERIQGMLEAVVQDSNVSVFPDHASTAAVLPTPSGLRGYLHDYTPAELPLDFPRSDAVSFDRAVHQFCLPKGACIAIGRLKSRGKDVTPSFLAAFSILEFRYSYNEDHAIALHMGNTTKSYQNTIVVRLPASGKATIFSVLECTRQAVIDALKYSDIPFSDVIDDLRSWNSAALRIAFVVEAQHSEESVAPDCNWPHFDMEWHLHAVDDEYRCDLVYNRALFRKESIEAFSNNFLDVLECIFNEAAFTVDEIPFNHAVKQLERTQIPISPPPQLQEPRGSLAEAFSKITAKYPEKQALIDGPLVLTYHELDILSSALAKRISDTAQGRDPYQFISFCIPPSALAILAIVGIIKYGAAYVPLDVRFPMKRLEKLLADSGAPLLITTSQSPEFDLKGSCVTRLDISDFLDNWRTTVTSLNNATLPSYPQRTDIAYVMYTSGSTGVPKGVVIKENSVLAFVSNQDIFPFEPDYSIAQINNLAWDASVLDVWCTFLSGATLICFNRYDILDPPTLAQQFGLFKIDCCFMSTALFRQILDVAPQLFSSLHTLMVGGEAVYYESFHKVRTFNPSITIRNMYGTTETCVISAAFSILNGDTMPEIGLVPIGRPFRTSQKLIVDAQGRLVPPGVIGELVIGGEGVGDKYLHRAAETSRAFVEMDFEGLPQPRSRFYRTGDAVKWCNGQMQFVGRLNTGQIKIRGQRLELTEIEAAIVRTGLVNNAAVVYHTSEGCDPHLIAYVVRTTEKPTNSSAESTPEEIELPEDASLQQRLLDYLRTSLPSYMVPSMIRCVSNLPLLPTGKLDRRQLDAQAAADSESLHTTDQNGSLEPPQDDVERRLCEIFEQLLKRAPIYRCSDFFANGGHSLLAQRLKVRIQRSFNVHLKVMDIFELPTPKTLGKRIKASTPESETGGIILPVVMFSQKPDKPYLFCIPMATGLGFSFAGLSQVASHLNVVAFNDPRYCDSSLNTCFEMDDERNTVPAQAMYYYKRILSVLGHVDDDKRKTAHLNIMGYSFGGHLAIEIARMAQRDGREVSLFVVDSSAHTVNQDWDASDALLDAALGHIVPHHGDDEDKLEKLVRLQTAVNIRALLSHTILPYAGHLTLFRSEANAEHGFGSLVGSLDEVVLRGDHFHLLEECTGNLLDIAERVHKVIDKSASSRS